MIKPHNIRKTVRFGMMASLLAVGFVLLSFLVDTGSAVAHDGLASTRTVERNADLFLGKEKEDGTKYRRLPSSSELKRHKNNGGKRAQVEPPQEMIFACGLECPAQVTGVVLFSVPPPRLAQDTAVLFDSRAPPFFA